METWLKTDEFKIIMSWQDEEEFYGFILKDVFEKSTQHSLKSLEMSLTY